MTDISKMKNISGLIAEMQGVIEDYGVTLDDYSIDFTIEYMAQVYQQDEDPDNLVLNIDFLSADITKLLDEANDKLNALVRDMNLMEEYVEDWSAD